MTENVCYCISRAFCNCKAGYRIATDEEFERVAAHRYARKMLDSLEFFANTKKNQMDIVKEVLQNEYTLSNRQIYQVTEELKIKLNAPRRSQRLREQSKQNQLIQ
jgi:hypothetical protein